MPIGVLTTSYPRHAADPAGGFVAELNRWLVSRGERVEVLAPAPASGARPGLSVRALRYAHRPRLLYGAGAPDNLLGAPLSARMRAWSQAPRFAARLGLEVLRRRGHWDGVLSHWLLPCGLLAARCAAGLPHLAIAHGSDVHLLSKLPLRRTLLAALARPRSSLVLTSEALRGTLLAAAGSGDARKWVDGAAVVRMGISPTPSVSPATVAGLRAAHGLQGRFVVLFLGRLVPVKGVDCLLRACAGDGALTPVIVGEGPQRPALERLAGELGCDARFVGLQTGDAKQAWLAAADALALPSVILPDGRSDSAPVVLLEAMAAGLPVVASAIGGATDTIEPEHNGLLVPPGHAPSLTIALQRLRGDPQLRATLARAGRETAAAHGWERVGGRLLALLKAL